MFNIDRKDKCYFMLNLTTGLFPINGFVAPQNVHILGGS